MQNMQMCEDQDCVLKWLCLYTNAIYEKYNILNNVHIQQVYVK